jgi:uncharacterized protein YndB with AHSA1/START domain
MIAFQTSIAIQRPIAEVFAYVSDPRNLADWNSAVTAVRPTARRSGGVGSIYSMDRRLPDGRATNRLEIVGHEPPHAFAVRATAGPTPFLYRYRFVAQDDGTQVQLDAEVELGGVAGLMPRLARHAVKKGVDDNLAALKLLLEEHGHARRLAG